MDEIEKLINDEMAKIDLYRSKISVCENRIQVLRSIQSEDAVDVAVDSIIKSSKKSASMKPSVITTISTRQIDNAVPTRVGPVSKFLLEELDNGADSLDILLERAEKTDLNADRNKLRSALFHLKTRFGFIENPNAGTYGISSKGREYLKSIKGESPATDNNETFSLQPASHQGAS